MVPPDVCIANSLDNVVIYVSTECEAYLRANPPINTNLSSKYTKYRHRLSAPVFVILSVCCIVIKITLDINDRSSLIA